MNNTWEDYYDPEQPLAYVAGPYSSLSPRVVYENIVRAKAARDALWARGWSVICPHANTAEMPNDDPALYYTGDLTQVRRCDMVYMLGGWQISKGARIEHDAAETWGIVCTYQVRTPLDDIPTAQEFRETMKAVAQAREGAVVKKVDRECQQGECQQIIECLERVADRLEYLYAALREHSRDTRKEE